MVGRRQALVKAKANRQGFMASVAGIGTIALFALTPWFFGAAGLGVTGYLTYKWLRYRGKWGLRF